MAKLALPMNVLKDGQFTLIFACLIWQLSGSFQSSTSESWIKWKVYALFRVCELSVYSATLLHSASIL